jgi:hypothetical protein
VHLGSGLKAAVLKPFLMLAAIGFVLSVISHVLAWLSIANPAGDQQWALHLGIFFVWTPAIFASVQLARDAPQRDFWKAVLRGCPPTLRRAINFTVGYAVLNFVIFALNGADSTEERVRGFSGHWMVFYLVAFAIMYSAIRVGSLDEPQTCPNGHRVSPFATYCQACGSLIRRTT